MLVCESLQWGTQRREQHLCLFNLSVTWFCWWMDHGCTLQTCTVFRSVVVSTLGGVVRSSGTSLRCGCLLWETLELLVKLFFNNRCVGTADPRVRRLGLVKEGNGWRWTKLNPECLCIGLLWSKWGHFIPLRCTIIPFHIASKCSYCQLLLNRLWMKQRTKSVCSASSLPFMWHTGSWAASSQNRY